MRVRINQLSVDVGYGNIKFHYILNGNIETGKFPSLIKKLSSNNTGIVDDNAIKYKEEFYYVGEKAKLLGSTATEVDLKEYANFEKYTPLILEYINHTYGLDPSSYCLGLSIAHLANSDSYRKYILEYFNLADSNLVLLPQGIGAKYAYQTHGRSYTTTDTSPPKSNYIIVDIGFNTVDCVCVIDGKTSTENLRGFMGEGVLKLTEKVLELFNNLNQSKFTLDEFKSSMESKVIKYKGKTCDYSKLVEQSSKTYLEHLMELIKTNYESMLDVSDGCLFVGGGAHYFRNVTLDGYPEKYFIIPDHPEFYNVIGYLLFNQ